MLCFAVCLWVSRSFYPVFCIKPLHEFAPERAGELRAPVSNDASPGPVKLPEEANEYLTSPSSVTGLGEELKWAWASALPSLSTTL